MKKHFLDLFSGLGGASEAFIQDTDDWTVLRIDNNPLLANVPNTMMDDIKSLSRRINGSEHTIDVVWASPPCREFSTAYNAPRSVAARGGIPYEPDMSLLHAAVDIIKTVKPRYWIIENVVGSIRYFAEELGEPRQIIGPYVLWGNFPTFSVDESKLESKKSKDKHSANPLRSNYKAKVDFEISQALKYAIENQKSIFQF
jgi:hypothetical protein